MRPLIRDDVLYKLTAKRAGPSSGTNLWGAFETSPMAAAGETGSVVTLICDSGERYIQSYYNDVWLAQRRVDLRPIGAAQEFIERGEWPHRQPRAVAERSDQALHATAAVTPGS